jgi:phosphoglycerol transferase MdoB-like AlkP superfamily enzyme
MSKKYFEGKSHLFFFLFIYLSGIFLFGFSRLIFIIYNLNQLSGIPFEVVLNSLFMGWRFDTVITCYIISVPFILYSIINIFNLRFKLFSNIIFYYMVILFSASLLICFADVPYYYQFDARLSFNAVKMDSSTVILKTIFEDYRYIMFFILYLLSAGTFTFIVLKINKYIIVEKWTKEKIYGIKSRIKSVAFSLVIIALLFLGIRGRVATSPIRWGTAFTSQYPFTNHLGLNPVFTFFRSYLDDNDTDNIKFDLINEETALSNVKGCFNSSKDSIYHSVLARKYLSQGKPLNCNVVLILMESMTALKMGIFGNQDNLTPSLDSIARNSLFFRNFYSDGIHTSSGVYASLFGFPTLRTRHPFTNTSNIQRFGGLPYTLMDNGYNTIMFVTQDEQWGNFGGFLTYNGFQKFISRKDYSYTGEEGIWGVPDHIMLEQAIPHLNALSKDSKPFFATLITASDHGPYILPEGISLKPKSAKVELQLVEYADWSLGNFMKSASKQSWFENTIFVFVADHGMNFKPSYEISLPYHHIPLIIYSPKYIKPKEETKLGEQIDIYPTILSILNISFINNSFGIDLTHENHKYIFFTSDENIGCMDNEYFYISTKTGSELLHKYQSEDLTNYLPAHEDKAKEMSAYSKSMLQAAQWYVLNRKVRYIPLP